MTQAQLAAQMEQQLPLDDRRAISKEMVRKWESGHVKLFRHPEIVKAAAAVLGVQYEELMDGRIQPDAQQSKRMRSIPVLGDLAAGSPDMATGNVEYIEVEEWETPENERWGRRAKGESMLPYIRKGQLCIFEDRSAESGDICHIYNPEQCVDTIKVYRVRHGVVTYEPTNPDHEPIPGDGWMIRGPLMQVRRKLGGTRLLIDNEDGTPLHVDDLAPYSALV